MGEFINRSFLPVEANIKEQATWFKRFDVPWTPTALLVDSEGRERFRIEGYLPRPEFFPQLKLGLGRIAFLGKRFAEAESLYTDIIEQHGGSASAAEAIYWRGVAQYKRTKDHTVLNAVAQQLNQRFPGSIWTEKASIWG
ncbi:MAG: hypothetical protein JO041_06545 [Acidobacteria bacterium]|nr:hypothetical protein [Acidobacteriota bacterium]